MREGYILGGGGGPDLDVITAGSEDILEGKVIVNNEGDPLTGTMPNRVGEQIPALKATKSGKALVLTSSRDGYINNSTAVSCSMQDALTALGFNNKYDIEIYSLNNKVFQLTYNGDWLKILSLKNPAKGVALYCSIIIEDTSVAFRNEVFIGTIFLSKDIFNNSAYNLRITSEYGEISFKIEDYAISVIANINYSYRGSTVKINLFNAMELINAL